MKKTLGKKICRLREWIYLKKCPNCKEEVIDKGLVTTFQDIWEHEIWLKECPKCGMRIWTPNGSNKFEPDLHQHEDCKDYDDRSWQGGGGIGTFKNSY